MQFGKHTPESETTRSSQAAASIFTRGLQAPGKQWKFLFPNGFGASVINDGYGGDRGLYEVAVLGLDGHLTYDTSVTNDVLGFLSESEVVDALDAIEALPAEVTA